ncbi:hypothetical protein [Rhodanobacter sp. C03]|uniref:hypothetical protein n=1 Tax=Rhodanobacter sp. C03 TaxID=1945858 RepID=UPI0009C8827D|nr:hypothetical protein [Rhodanobacter sp. C03]OOG54516.1 hypothetical protein B0E48_14625 [Rhodanobacter sp. C03]
MKRLLASLALIAAAATLSGCYYDPGYVRSSGYGGAYYTQVAPAYYNGYYAGPGYYDGGYYGYYGCCYGPSVNLWYGGSGYYRGGYGYRGYRGYPGGNWHGARASGAARGASHGSAHSSGSTHHH